MKLRGNTNFETPFVCRRDLIQYFECNVNKSIDTHVQTHFERIYGHGDGEPIHWRAIHFKSDLKATSSCDVILSASVWQAGPYLELSVNKDIYTVCSELTVVFICSDR